MNISDYITLARAGYTKQEINSLAGNIIPPPAASQTPYDYVQAHATQSLLMPNMPVTGNVAPAARDIYAPTTQIASAPASAPASTTDMLAAVLTQNERLMQMMARSNMLGAEQPRQKTAQDALASIIEPEPPVTGMGGYDNSTPLNGVVGSFPKR